MPSPPHDLSWLAPMLQTLDPLFPIGSYAHSYGLEELCATHFICDATSLLAYLENTVAVNLEEFELPYLRFAYNAFRDQDFDLLTQLDQEIAAAKLSKELRDASATQGQQRLRMLLQLRPSDTLLQLKSLQRANRITPHHLIIFAAENANSSAPLSAALSAWAYQSLAASCAASLKLIRIGQEGAQNVLTQALQLLPRCVRNSLEIEREFAGAFIPAMDIASHRHEQLNARLFIS